MAPELVIGHPQELFAILADRVLAAAQEALAARSSCAMVLTGGSLARMAFPRLARLPVDWSRVDFFQGDERAVPPGDAASNHREAQALWFGPAGVPAERVHRMQGEAADLDAAAREYAALLVRVLGTPPRVDLALLGAGPDGHVCSLFPGHPLLAERARWAAAIEDSPKPPAGRITLTLPTLAAARRVVIVALGRERAGVVREALAQRDSLLPVALVAQQGEGVVVLAEG